MKKYQKVLETHLQNGEFVGAVIGEFRDGEEQFISGGFSDLEVNQKMSINSAFEIGSITKVITGLLLEVLEDKGFLCLDSKVSTYIESLAPYNVGNIILRDLCSHYSGLSRLPERFDPSDWSNPYATYDLESFLSLIKEEKLGNRQYEYSNQGMALLGVVVDHIYGPGYEQAMHDFILNPLGLHQTFFDRNRYDLNILAKGYQAGGVLQVYWDLNRFSAAGALKSTAKDLLIFSKAFIDPDSSPLKNSILKQLRVLEEDSEAIRLNAWMMSKDSKYIYHGGGTHGFSSMLIIDIEKHTSMVVLANTYCSLEGYVSLFKDEPFSAKLFSIPPKNLISKIVGKFESHENDDNIFNYFIYKDQLYLKLDGQFAGIQEWRGDNLFVEESLNVTNLYDEKSDTILFKQDDITLKLYRVDET